MYILPMFNRSQQPVSHPDPLSPICTMRTGKCALSQLLVAILLILPSLAALRAFLSRRANLAVHLSTHQRQVRQPFCNASNLPHALL